MNIPREKPLFVTYVHLGLAVCGLTGFATPANAQTAISLSASGSESVAVSAMPASTVLADEELATRVKAAMHADPYFYDEHVTVSSERGAVVLRGFVLSDWDLRDALRIARKAAGDRPVIDNLSIVEGGRR